MARPGSAFVAAQFALFALIALSPRFVHSDWPWIVRAPGLVLAGAGLALCVWAIRALGPAMTAMPEPREDVPVATGGPYAFVRHPVYSGAVAVGIGYSLARCTWAGLVFSAVLAVLFDLKSRYEERLLVRDSAYVAYRARTPRRFLPRLY
jgi:protein-S-isoprenylcysteine O-methyltransferase Ste14